MAVKCHWQEWVVGNDPLVVHFGFDGLAFTILSFCSCCVAVVESSVLFSAGVIVGNNAIMERLRIMLGK